MKICILILTFNEAKHIQRVILSALKITQFIFVVDSHSTDETVEIANKLGARVFVRDFKNQSDQFNWALTQLPQDTDWVFRLDADEILSSPLVDEIKSRLPDLQIGIDGVFLIRRIRFQGSLIKYGHLASIRVLRLFRFNRGQCENRWMDEHIKVLGKTIDFDGEIIDDNLNSLTWWIEKHNRYASREVVDLLNLDYKFMPQDSIASLKGFRHPSFKRWLKEYVYARLPLGLRAFFYFFYRYVLRFGFLDGASGSTFHILQAFWYRYLVDAKLIEVKKYMSDNKVDVKVAIYHVLNIKI